METFPLLCWADASAASMAPAVPSGPNPTALILLLASGAYGLAVFLVVRAALSLLGGATQERARDLKSYEENRLFLLRKRNAVFRNAEALVREFARRCRGSERLSQIRSALPLAERNQHWQPEEYLAVIQVESLLCGAGLGLFFWLVAGPVAGLIAGVFVFYLFGIIRLNALRETAASAKESIKKDLPFAVDIMSLIQGSGDPLDESVEIIAREAAGTPMGDLFSGVEAQMNENRPLEDALMDVAEQVQDEDFLEVASLLKESRKSGAELLQMLRNLSDQVRLKRQQWGEKVAAQAQVKIIFPGMIIMIGCMMVIIFPFLLQAIYRTN